MVSLFQYTPIIQKCRRKRTKKNLMLGVIAPRQQKRGSVLGFVLLRHPAKTQKLIWNKYNYNENI